MDLGLRYFHLYTSPLETNTYIVINGKKAFVIDPGGSAKNILMIIHDAKAKLEAILITHAHFDHIGAVADLVRLCSTDRDGNVYDELKPTIIMHQADYDKVGSYKNMAFSMNEHVEKFVPDILVKGGEELNVCGVKVKVIHTPGHSKGSVCYIFDKKVFVGDLLFYLSYGRTDFYDGSFQELKNSIINKLFRLKGNYTLLTGHGEPTTLKFEQMNNPILQTDNDAPTMVE